MNERDYCPGCFQLPQEAAADQARQMASYLIDEYGIPATALTLPDATGKDSCRVFVQCSREVGTCVLATLQRLGFLNDFSVPPCDYVAEQAPQTQIIAG